MKTISTTIIIILQAKVTKKKNLISQIQINSNSNNKLCKAIKVGSYLLIDNLLEGSHILRKNQVLTHIVAIPYLH